MRLYGHRVKAVLPPPWYGRPTVRVARELLGKILFVRSNPSWPLHEARCGLTARRIVETEAYHGDDPASHCSRGRTSRCAVMFGPAGRAYVYFVYGMYEMLNFVTEREGYPGAVLIRAVEPLAGHELMARRSGQTSPLSWTSGPGRLCRAMGITLGHKGESLEGPRLFVADDGWRPKSIGVSGRIGIKVGAEKRWRFFVVGNPYVSRPNVPGPASPIRRRRNR